MPADPTFWELTDANTNTVVQRFNALSSAQQQDVLNFLRSL